MKDVAGREYDGWVLKHANGRLILHTFSRTRTQAFGQTRIARPKLRRMGLRAVKVVVREVID